MKRCGTTRPRSPCPRPAHCAEQSRRHARRSAARMRPGYSADCSKSRPNTLWPGMPYSPGCAPATGSITLSPTGAFVDGYATAAGGGAIFFLAVSASPRDQLRCARVRGGQNSPARPAVGGERYGHDDSRRLSLGGFSRSRDAHLTATTFRETRPAPLRGDSGILQAGQPDAMRTRLRSV